MDYNQKYKKYKIKYLKLLEELKAGARPKPPGRSNSNNPKSQIRQTSDGVLNKPLELSNNPNSTKSPSNEPYKFKANKNIAKVYSDNVGLKLVQQQSDKTTALAKIHEITNEIKNTEEQKSKMQNEISSIEKKIAAEKIIINKQKLQTELKNKTDLLQKLQLEISEKRNTIAAMREEYRTKDK